MTKSILPFILIIMVGSVSGQSERSGAASGSTKNGTKSDGDARETPLRLFLQLSDGSQIIGVPALDSVPIQTSFAKVKIPLALIHTMEFKPDHETVLLSLKNGDKLRGVADLDEIQMKTIFGEVAIPAAHLTSARVLSDDGSGPIRDGLILWLDPRDLTKERWPDRIAQSGDGINHNVAKTADDLAEFNGTDSIVTIPRKHLLKNFTLMVWAKKSDAFSRFEESIFSCGEDGGFYIDYGGASSNDAEWRAVVSTDAGVRQNNFIRRKFSTSWVMFTMVHDGQTLRLYQDGALGNSIAVPGGTRSSTSHYVLGMRQPGKPCYKGYLGDVFLYERALSDEEIKQHFETGKTRFSQP